MGYRLATDASRTTSNGGGWRDWGIGPCQISLGLTESLLCPSLLGLIPESFGLIILEKLSDVQVCTPPGNQHVPECARKPQVGRSKDPPLAPMRSHRCDLVANLRGNGRKLLGRLIRYAE